MTPKVVIVGRPNVGKSSLLNLLAKRRVSIVDPTAGVTRDRVSFVVTPAEGLQASSCHNQFELFDTGGYGVDDAENLTAEIRRQIALAIADAHLVLFVVDAQSGVVPLDHEVARLLRTSASQSPVLLIANKVDDQKHESSAYEATQLGFGSPVMASATSGRNKAVLLETILQHIAPAVNQDPTEDSQASTALLAIAGKRNAGKSTLVNALAGSPRVIVSELAGTTRDSVDVRFEMDGQTFTAIDTAGVRKTKSLSGDIEYYSYHRTLRSVRRADVVLLLIDATVPISHVDRQLATEILHHHKPCVIVLNKWDLAQENYTEEQYAEYLDDALKELRFAPIVFVSAKHSEGLREAVSTAMALYRQANRRVSTSELNRVMEQILSEKTPSSKIGVRPKIYYATQLDTHPPTIGLFVNKPDLFDSGYQRFLINRLRDLMPFAEVPIKLLIRGKNSSPRPVASASRQDS